MTTSTDPGWRRFFATAAATSDQEPFTRATAQEVEFLRSVLDLQPGTRLLDVGCGTGRHAVPLAGAGIEVTGVDLSPDMLQRAAARAAGAGTEVTLIEADARDLPGALVGFDAAICLCEGAFCLVADDAEPIDHDRSILRSIHRALRPGGRLVLTALNAGRLLTAWRAGEVAGEVDPMTCTATSEHRLADGSTVLLQEHHHLPDGLHTLAASVGFDVEAVWAGGAGDWRREPPSVSDHELLLLARRPG